MSLGRSIRLYLVDGSSKGIIHAEVINWTGQIALVPRMKLVEYIQRQPIAKTGLYVLTAQSSEPGEVIAYIGETDDVRQRLKSQKSKRDFWESACVITSKDSNLTKAHVKYLESRLIALAREYRRAELENEIEPVYTALPEPDMADMEYFIQQIQLVLPVLGVTIFQPQASKEPQALPRKAAAEGRVLRMPTKRLDLRQYEDDELFILQQGRLQATARIIDGEFVLLKGSWVNVARQSSDPAGHLLRRYLKEGRLQPAKNNYYESSENIAFRSPSGAASFVLGRTSNGRSSWKTLGSDLTFAQWEEEATKLTPPEPIKEIA